jgi:hypothetical protein
MYNESAVENSTARFIEEWLGFYLLAQEDFDRIKGPSFSLSVAGICPINGFIEPFTNNIKHLFPEDQLAIIVPDKEKKIIKNRADKWVTKPDFIFTSHKQLDGFNGWVIVWGNLNAELNKRKRLIHIEQR